MAHSRFCASQKTRLGLNLMKFELILENCVRSERSKTDFDKIKIQLQGWLNWPWIELCSLDHIKHIESESYAANHILWTSLKVVCEITSNLLLIFFLDVTYLNYNLRKTPLPGGKKLARIWRGCFGTRAEPCRCIGGY